LWDKPIGFLDRENPAHEISVMDLNFTPFTDITRMRICQKIPSYFRFSHQKVLERKGVAEQSCHPLQLYPAIAHHFLPPILAIN
jgi:hypothetical protein